MGFRKLGGSFVVGEWFEECVGWVGDVLTAWHCGWGVVTRC
jgi:hypothetical protein